MTWPDVAYQLANRALLNTPAMIRLCVVISVFFVMMKWAGVTFLIV